MAHPHVMPNPLEYKTMDAISDPVIKCMECHAVSDATIFRGWMLVCDKCRKYLESLEN